MQFQINQKNIYIYPDYHSQDMQADKRLAPVSNK